MCDKNQKGDKFNGFQMKLHHEDGDIPTLDTIPLWVYI